jgi:hypothetical protein
MTYDEDPARWTSSPDEAPELLRSAFRAAHEEGPNRTQMRSLALKLAAASAGGAVAVGTVNAASAGQTLATAASWSAGKIAAVVAIAGTLVTGGAVVLQAGPGDQAHVQERVASSASPAPTSDVAERASGELASPKLQPGTPHVQPAEGTPIVEALAPVERESQARPTTEPAGVAKQVAAPSAVSKSTSASVKAAHPTAAKLGSRASPPARVQPPEPAGLAREAAAHKRAAEKPSAPQSEIQLLRRAQVALTGRPREAFQLTQEHRKLYPAGEFAQERDALAIQALMRVGDSEKARDLAAAFIRSYPGSPHAHRFREAMGLR